VDNTLLPTALLDNSNRFFDIKPKIEVKALPFEYKYKLSLANTQKKLQFVRLRFVTMPRSLLTRKAASCTVWLFFMAIA